MYTKNISGKVYQKLIEYSLKKIDTFSLVKYENRYDNVFDKLNKINEIIMADPKYCKEMIVNNYSNKLINSICKDYQYDEQIIKIEREDLFKMVQSYNEEITQRDGMQYTQKKLSFTELEKSINDRVRNSIEDCLEMIFYNENCKRFINDHNRDKISETQKFYNKTKDCKLKYQTEILFKVSEDTKEMLLSRQSIFDWIEPFGLEDLCLYKHGDMWLWSVAHEELCYIACENEEEYEYLKSMGVEFYADEYVPEKREI